MKTVLLWVVQILELGFRGRGEGRGAVKAAADKTA